MRRGEVAGRIKIVLVLPPSPEPLSWSAPRFLLRQRVTRGARLACEADIEGGPGSRVWLRRTSCEADLEGVLGSRVWLRRTSCARKGGLEWRSVGVPLGQV
jgi:hypothetical protein